MRLLRRNSNKSITKGIINIDNINMFLNTYTNLKENLNVTNISSILFKFIKEYYLNNDKHLESNNSNISIYKDHRRKIHKA